ncbi:pantoate--beta-alanine ligase [Flavobacteriaceae bacterium]|nr:pantoate--beta-alanine ligase [Flavobacteriaceae bacterium]
MKVFNHSKELNALKNKLSAKSIGLVPTMGALHKGHITLVEKALSENELVIVSIFINPTQFNNQDDLKNYPKTLESDLSKLKALENNIWVYAPEVSDVYSNSVTSKEYSFGLLESTMEGAHRKGHFQGVATIVQKLFEILKPTKAYFGEKDFQQLQIITSLVKQEQIPVKIIACPIIRHEDGLAMSSRNTNLSDTQRAIAPIIYETLQKAVALKEENSLEQIEIWITDFFNKHPEIELEYFTVAEEKTLQKVNHLNGEKTRAFIALKLGDVRLIDNVKF